MKTTKTTAKKTTATKAPAKKAPAKKAVTKTTAKAPAAKKAAAPKKVAKPAVDILAPFKAALATVTDKEALALRSAFVSSDGNGHDFGFTDHIKVPGLTEAGNGGVVSSLIKKGLITAPADDEFKQFAFMDWSDNRYDAAKLVEAFIATLPAAPVSLELVPVATEVIPMVRKSSITNPVEWVWGYFDQCKAEADKKGEKISRKGSIAGAVASGIAFYTARTQYQNWKTANKF